MDGDEQVGPCGTGQFHPFAQAEIVIPIANQHRLHASLPVDHLRQLAGEGEHHILFISPPSADAPGSSPP